MRRRRRKKREEVGAFNLSFLDAISCGFGALVILLVLTKMGEPFALEESRQDLDALIAALKQELFEIRGETTIIEQEFENTEKDIVEVRNRLAGLREELSRISGSIEDSDKDEQVQRILETRLRLAQQSLTDEMQRLQAQELTRPMKKDVTVGGIPVDSEYIVFVIDTSGSMASFAWPLVVKKMEQVLSIYPKVKGIQIMNDMGQYMFPGYAGKWIPDTPSRRKIIVQRLAGWSVFSNSSPVEGITRAIRTFATPEHKMSIYVFGDEFTGGSIDDVVRTIDRINPKDADGKPMVRIHGIGFPVIFSERLGGAENTGVRFASLMRILCRRNAGTFVALNSATR